MVVVETWSRSTIQNMWSRMASLCTGISNVMMWYVSMVYLVSRSKVRVKDQINRLKIRARYG